mgnify:FL=1
MICMSIFIYSATDRAGKVAKGERQAENEKTLAQALKAEGYFLLEAKERGAGGLSSLHTNLNLTEVISRLKPIGLVDKMFFARNLAVMISAGLSLTRAMEALKEESSSTKFKKILADVNDAVAKGRSFADSLKMHPKVFSEIFVSMVEVGEASGKLTLVLKLLANQMKKDHDLQRRVRGAMMYPAVIIIALFAIGTLMMIYVVPTLTQTIKELGVPLPLTTRIIITFSELIANYAVWLLIGLMLAVAAFWRILKTAKGKEIFDTFIIRVPIFGALVKKFNTGRLCRILAYLITSGVPIVRALEITSGVLGNTLYRKATAAASKEIQTGKQLHIIFEPHKNIFQPMVIQMISVGEETGKISDMMLRLALFFEEDVTSTTKNLSTIIEPILMIIIGTAVGIFAISMLQPIYSSLGNIGG